MTINYEAEATSESYYFAYGSNLNLRELTSALEAQGIHSQAVTPVKPAQLPDMMLAFNYFSFSRGGGALNVVPRRGHRVTGYLFQLSAEAWRLIDRKEGHPNVYCRTPVIVIDDTGNYIPAITYVVTPDKQQGFTLPTEEYLNSCIEGRNNLKIESDSVLSASENQENGALRAVFCYGTLMRGERRFSTIRRHRVNCSITAEIIGQLLDCGDYPGMVPTNGKRNFVPGEFFIFRNIYDALGDMDAIEGFESPMSPANLFRRIIADVGVGDGRVRTAWAYFLADELHPVLEPEDWRKSQGHDQRAFERIVDLHYSANPEFFYQRLTGLLNRWHREGDPAPPLLDRAAVISGFAQGKISERKMTQASGLSTAGWGPDAIW